MSRSARRPDIVIGDSAPPISSSDPRLGDNAKDIDSQMISLRSTAEYAAIAAHYAGRSAERSGVAYLDHIEQGMAVMVSIGAPTEAILAYCLHPMCQGDDDLAAFDPSVASTPTVLMYAMEYRNVANRFLSHHFEVDTRDALLSPLPAVNQMLVADKVQNRKDFEIYHATSHPNRHRLRGYFARWLDVLGIDEAEYQQLADVCMTVSGKTWDEADGIERSGGMSGS